MLLFIAAIIGGFLLLVWTADRFVIGASSIARNWGVPPLVVGLTIVGFGTSAPEIFVSAVASWEGSPTLGIGNALGSNIANIGLILGFTALIVPLAIRSETLKREFPILLVVMLLALLLLIDDYLGRIDGIILIVSMAVILYWLVRLAMGSRRSDPIGSEYAAEMPKHISTIAAFGWFMFGLIGLLISSQVLVWGAVGIARLLGISELVIGLSIVAVGTSLPELATSVMGAIKKEHDLAIGNVIGSNMFNLLVVMAMPGLIQPTILPDQILTRDFSVMVGLTVALFGMAYGFGGPGRLNRWEGGVLLIVFVVYQCFIFYSI